MDIWRTKKSSALLYAHDLWPLREVMYEGLARSTSRIKAHYGHAQRVTLDTARVQMQIRVRMADALEHGTVSR